ncbi:UV DNA damage repair endonuclease UvsE [Rossellomorea vietnamensis]|uniref:UV DNA damage repair endonuclease UvsE n=1 Tax=Rossellomorea vietnamensis TaxID=218284 RepID=A0A5D4MAJ0_9BACI|nr:MULTISPECIES: UV DNA damage repair endonuclease UvsE [Bacillaceae]TYR97990.1 UV DNA damage repair endonuclease UvsE [Rossellomorea vietnamensis]
MTIVRLGYVAMSVHLENASPSQTMTFKQFSQLKDREAGLRKLERIAVSNLQNCLRLLKHNLAHDIRFFRFSSKLIPLANHPELRDWKFMRALKEPLREIGDFIRKHPQRVGFHPDHFVLLNTSNKDTLKNTMQTLKIHEALLRGMDVAPNHRCVLHVGGAYEDKEKALEQFIHNWGLTPVPLQELVILENDDTVFTLQDTLYLCEKLGIPMVFDYHHHLAHNEKGWEADWERVAGTWENSSLPVKMHISSPRSASDFKAHAEYIDPAMFMDFINGIKGTVDEIDCMIEAKKKDDALFRLVEDLKDHGGLRWIDGASFEILS